VVLPADVEYDCNALPGSLDPGQTGWPQIGGVDLTTDGTGACGLGVSYEDNIVNVCAGSYKIVRTWTIYDWCPAGGGDPVTLTGVQYVKVLDVAPTIELSSVGYDAVNDWWEMSANEYSEDYQGCAATGPVPVANMEGVCNGIVNSFVSTPVGNTTNGGLIPSPGLPLGQHELTYVAEDECGNITSVTIVVNVVDDIAPTAICKEITDVNLSSEGEALVPAEDFDNGSYDNCCLDHFEVRRMDGDCEGNYDEFGPEVRFCCSDAGQTVMVVFRVYDCDGNYNDCMVQVNVEDKIPPIVVSCPSDQTITCDDYLANYASSLELGDSSVLEGFGSPLFYDNCDLTEEYSWSHEVNTCTEGQIVRTWTATDGHGNPEASCEQVISIEHVDDWYVVFPGDLIAQCVDGTLPDFGEPEIFDDECELIGVSYEDEQYDVVQDACYKIIRHWSVVNWCTYPDGLSYTHDQVIKVVDEEAPIFEVADQTYCIEESDCDVSITLPTPDVTDCSPDITITVTSADLAAYATGDQYNYSNVPPGEYVVGYEVEDGCGNHSYDEMVVTVVDCKKPTPYCVEGLVIEIMQTGMIDIWAEDFDAGSFDNCPGALQLSLSPDVNDKQRIYTCADLGGNSEASFGIELWVTDASGNQDYCETFVTVQDNMGVCGGGGNPVVAGVIETEWDAAVEGVEVEVNGGAYMDMTDNAGMYSLSLPAGGDYTVSPQLDADADNGVTALDMVLISRHILGVDLLDSPYQLIAADANNSKQITTLDLVAIQQVILLMTEHFPNNTSWRFVDADYVFPDPTNPWLEDFPEVINYNNLTEDDLQADFVGVKIGDVNGSAVTNAGSGSEVELHGYEGDVIFELEDRLLESGEEAEVWFEVSPVSLVGYQYSLEYAKEKIEVEEVLEGVSGKEDFGMFEEAGVLTTSWYSEEARTLGGEAQFGLRIRAKESVRLSEVFAISSRYTPAVGYGVEGEPLSIQLRIGGELVQSGYALYGNSPNPFKEETVIGFYLPQGGQAVLTVMDAQGRVLRRIKGEYGAGYQEVVLKDLGVSGVLYCRLESGDYTAVRKMIAN